MRALWVQLQGFRDLGLVLAGFRSFAFGPEDSFVVFFWILVGTLA